MIEFFYYKLTQAGGALSHLFLLSIRLLWGWQFFVSGQGKLTHIPAIAEYFQSLHIPLPVANAYMVGTIELIGGACLFVGLFSRLISLPLIGTMVVALLTAESDATLHFFRDPLALMARAPFTFLMAALTIFSFGSGFFSLDRLFKIEK